MFVVGLTGGIGSGKSAAADEFARLGASVVDTDAIAHALTQPGGAAVPEIEKRFGKEFVPDGAMDRKKMRDHVFADPAAKRALEALLHPMIREESARLIAAARTQVTRAARLAAADDVIDNAGSRDALRNQVAALHQKYLQFAKP